MTVPTLRSAGTVVDVSVFTGAAHNHAVNVPYPATISADDLLIVSCGYYGNAGVSGQAINTPSGWTEIANQHDGQTRHKLIAKIATGSESGNLGMIWVNNPAQTGRAGAQMFAWQDTNAPNGVLADCYEDLTTSTSGADPTPAPSLTCLGADRRALWFLTVNDDNVGPVSATGETGGDWTRTHYTNIGTIGAISLQQAAMAAGGTISGGSGDLTAARTVNSHALLLRPYVAPVAGSSWAAIIG